MKFFLCFFIFTVSVISAQQKEVLVFHKAEGFYHKSIPAGIQAIEELGEENGFEVTETKDSGVFSEENLKEYDLVIFLNTTGDVLDEAQQTSFENYMENGGNFLGIHSAADTEHDWEWYGHLTGAYFLDHPEIQEAEINVVAHEHPTVSHLPETWKRTDEWYNYKNIHPENKVLLTLDEKSYKGGKNGEVHPIAWFKKLKNGGISLYTGGGHIEESYVEPLFREHLRRNILFAMGK